MRERFRMKDSKKILGEKRRELILTWLKESTKPLTGSELADKTNVSRQVIVQDVSLLKARNEPIIATSGGYIYLQANNNEESFSRVIACCHTPEDTLEELRLIVDNGVTVKDVKIEHPVYGDLTASIMVSNRTEVSQFIEKVESTNAAYLSELTDGTHLHTIEADSVKKLNSACHSLKQAGFFVE